MFGLGVGLLVAVLTPAGPIIGFAIGLLGGSLIATGLSMMFERGPDQ